MSILRDIYDLLVEFYGKLPSESWWPDDPREVIVGAVLVPGSNWKTVAHILESLKADGLLDFALLRQLPLDELIARVRPAGFQQRKAAALHDLLLLIGDDLDGFFARDVTAIRRDLLGIKGIGTSVADNILLYAAKLPVYMVDPFTVRILVRHGVVAPRSKEEEVQRLIHQELTHDAQPHGAALFHAFQSLIVRVGRDYCDKSDSACWHCPLQSLLPEGGPIMPERPRRAVPRGYDLREKPAQRPLAFGFETPTASFSQETSGSAPDSWPSDLNDNERLIMERLDTLPRPIDTVIQETGLAAHLVQATLVGLEFKRLVRRCEGNEIMRLG